MKIFIIENTPNEFNRSKKIFETDFGCEIYPLDNNAFLENYLNLYARAYTELKKENPDKVNDLIRQKDVYKNLMKQILSVNDTYAYLVDINLDASEGSGELLFKDLKEAKKENELIKVYKFTGNSGDETITKMIKTEDQREQFRSKLGIDISQKKGVVSEETLDNIEDLKKKIASLKAINNKLEKKIENNIGNRYFFYTLVACFIIYTLYSLAKYTNVYGLGDFIEKMESSVSANAMGKKNMVLSSLFGVIILHGLYEKWRTFEKFETDLTTIASRLDSWITMFFYYFIIISLGISVISFINIFQKGENTSLHIAENLFIVFLPVIIVMSFYFFYKRSMQKIITDTADYDVEQGIKLMNITKTFFISSIISYSIVKIIEIISDKEGHLKKALSEIEAKTDPIKKDEIQYLNGIVRDSFSHYTIIQISLYFLMIILLMIFYVKIKHHPNEK